MDHYTPRAIVTIHYRMLSSKEPVSKSSPGF